MADINNLNEAWEGHSGLEVETFIKNEFKKKIGAIRFYKRSDDATYYRIQGFASSEDKALYESDPETYASLVVEEVEVPISTVKNDSYVATLSTSRSTATEYLVADGDSFEIPIRFNATHIIAATSQQEPMSGNGTLVIEKSANGTTWTQVKSQTIAASGESTGYPVTIDLKGLLNTGAKNFVRLKVSFAFVDSESNERTISSTPLVINVTSVSLGLETTTAWQEPQVDQSALSLAYSVRGSIARTLHLKVTGSAGTYETTQSLTASQTATSFSLVEQSSYGFLTTGVKTCEAWLTAGSPSVGELESEHLVVRIMVVNSSSQDALTPRLLISEMRSEVENFVQTRLLSYAVYSPVRNGEGVIVNNGPAIATTFILSSSANSIISVEQAKYASILVNAAPGTKYNLDMTVEIEQEGDTLASFLHATREVNGVVTDFLLDSIGVGSIYVAVDNTAGFQPTSGSTFLLNPKQRNNDEDNPKTILNARANNAVVPSTWTNFRLGREDGYIKDANGESCLRIPAGRILNIAYNPFALLFRSPNASMTIEMDVCVRNVTNEDDPIVRLAEQVSGAWRGLRLLPMVGYMTTESWGAEKESDFRWQEDVRTHIAINIVNAVYPNAHGDALVTADKEAASRGSLPLVRVLINGKINRELVYTPNTTEFCTGSMSNGGMTFGQDGADIDIYGIRIWESASLTPENVFQDFISTIPDSNTKRRLRELNDIIDPNTGLIGLDYITGLGAVEGIKKNWLIWHGEEPYHEDAHKGKTGWYEWGCYDDEGNYMPEYSGKVCERTKSLPQKAQGTTAKTYYYHNIQWKISDVTETIDIAISLLHSSITAVWDENYEWLDDEDQPTGEVGAWMLKGGCLGKNFPLPTESALPYHGTSTTVIVPDGWFDGNGKYRGQCSCIAPGTPLFQKSVNKINYASSMQSHIIGVNWLYNELHTAIVGKNTMQSAVDNAVVAKYLKPFLFFTQQEGAERAVFRGPCAWGAGKMDKPAWGYVKSAHPDFCMIEGADNDKPLTDMRVPFDDVAHGSSPAKVYYDPEEEAFLYRVKGGTTETCLDFDAGKTDDDGYPKANIVGYIRNAWNFLYLHAPRVRHYNGTLTEFLVDAELAQRPITSETTPEERAAIEAAQARVNTANKYWCRSEGGSSSGDYLLKRYDFCDGEWVDAGLWDGTKYAQIDLRTDSMTSAAWNALTEAQRAQNNIVAAAFVTAIVAHAKANIGSYFKVDSLKFHYAFQNHFVAGTDNCSKNTYYVLDPVTHLFELHQDDVDTTFATDNSGLQSKPYYIDRMHPYGGAQASRVAMTGDVDNSAILYEGYYNVLFDLCELMYENTLELQAMMRTIFEHMASLTGGQGSAESDNMSGVWRALNRYVFDIQRYFPAVVYNEAARIRYELPELIGFLSDVRSVHPIKQSLGDQLEAEMQFMKRRLVYMASYAAFGDFTPTSLRSGLTGLSEATASFGMQKFAIPGSSMPSAYLFNLVPHQWIYPTGGRETSNLIDPHTRVAPGETFALNIDPGQASDLGINVFGLNYYRELGNVGDMVANDGASSFTLNGRRLTKFEAVPTVFYTDEHLPAFRVNGFIIGTATRLKVFNVKGAVLGNSTLDLSGLTVCESIDARDTNVPKVNVPETSALTTLKLPNSLTELSLTAQSNLSQLTLDGYSTLTKLIVKGCGSLNNTVTLSLCNALRTEDNNREAKTNYVDIDSIVWTNVSAALMRWIIGVGDRGTCDLEGSVTLPSGQILSFDEVVALINRYGNIRSSENALYVSFPSQAISAAFIGITGRKYIIASKCETDSQGRKWWKDLGLVVTQGNNVAIAANGKPAVTWSIQSGDTTFVEFPDPYSPDLLVKQLIQLQTEVVVVTMRTTTGDTISVEKTIGLWNRVPEVGDFAWTDGEFDKEDDTSKKLAGAVVMREVLETDEDDNIKKARIWVVGTENATMPASSDGGSSQVVSYNGQNYINSWGIYPDATYGFSDAKTDGVYNDELLEAIRQATANNDVFETPLTNRGGDLTINAANYQDASNALPVTGLRDSDDGTTIVSGAAIGDGTGYKQQTATNAISDFATIVQNKTLIDYANKVLTATLDYLTNKGYGISVEDMPAGCTPLGIPYTLQGLADITQLIIKHLAALMQGVPVEQADVTEAGLARFRELLFPAIRLAQCWSPAQAAGSGLTEEDLAEQYRRGKWMLPANGLEGRIYNFYYNSRGGNASGAAASRQYANEDVANEALLPLFSNIMERSDGRRSIPMSQSSNHWCVTENSRNLARHVHFSNGNTNNSTYKYYSTVVRPVAAYIFDSEES